MAATCRSSLGRRLYNCAGRSHTVFAACVSLNVVHASEEVIPLHHVSDAIRLAGLTVLIVEDHADSREALGDILISFGARVLLARNGVEALAILARVTPDVVLCDLWMPAMDGFALLEHVRQDRRLAHLPVIAVTALGDPANVSRTRHSGFAGHFIKPLDVEDLVPRLEEGLPRFRDSAA